MTQKHCNVVILVYVWWHIYMVQLSNVNVFVCLASGLSVVLFCVTQDELLNRLMIFGTAGTVDSLCHLNDWGRCSIPIHALQVHKHTNYIMQLKYCSCKFRE